MALIFNRPEREIDVRGTLLLTTGSTLTLSPDNVMNYSIQERSATNGFALGGAESATYSLTIDNSDHKLTALHLNGAKVVMEAGISTDGEMQYVPFGVWYVTSPQVSEQSAVAVLDGGDVLELRFDSVFADNKNNYPRTVGALLSSVCATAGVVLKSDAFRNSTVSISKLPSWPKDTTLRGVVSYIAAVAGGFARIDRSGELEIVEYGKVSPTGTITADTYMTLETGNGTNFGFNCLAVKYMDADDYTRYTVADRVDTASNTIQIDSNPLYTVAIANSVKNALVGFESESVRLDWIGDPTLNVGDIVLVEGITDTEYVFVVNSQSIRYDGGLSANTEAALPSEGSSSAGYVTSEPAINASGMVNGGKIVAGSITAEQIAAGSITADKIAAGSITADKIEAGSITSDKIQSGAITADKIDAGAITADKIDAGAITADKIDAGAITADKIATDALEAISVDAITGAFNNLVVNDELYASLARVMELAADSIRAGNIIAGSVTADKLATVLADIVTLQAATGKFDLATVKNLLADALILKEGQAGSMQITNLAVTSANLLNATIGELVLKGSDGLYYRVYVGADGIIHTEVVTVSQGEINAGQTTTGEQIVDTSANINGLNAQSIKGQSAIIDQIVTTSLTAGKITAMDALIASATIPTLYATSIQAIGNSLDLSANESIRLAIAQKNAIYFKAEEPKETVVGDMWIDSNTYKTYIYEGMTGRNLPKFDFEDSDLLYAFGEDADKIELQVDEDGNLLVSVDGVEVRSDGCLYTTNKWREFAPSELRNSFIEIMQDAILIKSGGNIHIGAGGKLDVNAGSAHFATSDYTLSILAGDGTEDTVLDFDSESKTLRVDEINAANVRPYIAGTTAVFASDIGGIDGLADMLNGSKYEHLVYTQDYDEVSTEPIVINGCDSTLVDIIAGGKTKVPPMIFDAATSNIYMENLEWACLDGTALDANSGNIRMKGCIINAANGVVASRHANVVWIGDTNLATVGSCSADAFKAYDGATIRMSGMIPTGTVTKETGGVIESSDASSGTVVPPVYTDEVTTTLSATTGFYGSKTYWNSGELYQGYTNAKGEIYGCMRFALPSDVGSITSATLTLKADSGIGTGAMVNVRVYGSATSYGSKPSLGTRYINKSSAVAAGQSCSIDATDAAVALFDGTAKQLVLYTGETAVMSGKSYSKHYAKFSSAKLKITYRR